MKLGTGGSEISPSVIHNTSATSMEVIVVVVLSILLKLLLAFPVPSLLFFQCLNGTLEGTGHLDTASQTRRYKIEQLCDSCLGTIGCQNPRCILAPDKRSNRKQCASHGVAGVVGVSDTSPHYTSAWDQCSETAPEGQCGTRERSWYCLGETGSIDRSIPPLPHFASAHLGDE